MDSLNATMTVMTLSNESFISPNDSLVAAANYDGGKCAEYRNFTTTPDEEIVSRMFYTNYVCLLMAYALPTILTIGLIGNLAFLFTLTRVPIMRTITNAYLAALAITDICFIVIIGSRYIWTISKSPLVFNNPFRKGVGCALFSSAANFLFFESNLLVSLVSYERYLAICHTLKHRAFNTGTRTAKQIAATVIIAFGISLTLTPKISEMRLVCVTWPERKPYFKLPTVLYYCTTTQPIFDNYPPLLQGTCFLITLCAHVFFYSKIIRQLLHQTKTIVPQNQPKFQIQRQKLNRQITIMLGFNATVFCFCLFPYHFFLLQNVVERLSNRRLDLLDNSASSLLFWISTTLNTVNSSINPIIYSGVNSRYRQALLQAFRYRNNERLDLSDSAPGSKQVKLKTSSTRDNYVHL